MESFETEAEAKRQIRAANLAAPGQLTVGQAITRYELFKRDEAPRHQRKGGRGIDTTIMRLRNWLDVDDVLSSMTPRRIRTIYQERQRQCAVATHRNELAEVKTFFNWCVEQRLLSKSPAAEVKGVGKRNRRKEQFKRSEARQWALTAAGLADAGDEGAVALLIAFLQAMRASEVLALRADDIDISDDGITIIYIRDGKTEKSVAPLEVHEPRLRGWLQQLAASREPGQWLFPSSRDARSGHREHNWLRNAQRRVCHLAGVPYMVPHSLRGANGTAKVRGGLSLQDVAEDLRHENPRTTREHYIEPTALRQADIAARSRFLN